MKGERLAISSALSPGTEATEIAHTPSSLKCFLAAMKRYSEAIIPPRTTTASSGRCPPSKGSSKSATYLPTGPEVQYETTRRITRM